jgi:hypothetical protein
VGTLCIFDGISLSLECCVLPLDFTYSLSGRNETSQTHTGSNRGPLVRSCAGDRGLKTEQFRQADLTVVIPHTLSNTVVIGIEDDLGQDILQGVVRLRRVIRVR